MCIRDRLNTDDKWRVRILENKSKSKMESKPEPAAKSKPTAKSKPAAKPEPEPAAKRSDK